MTSPGAGDNAKLALLIRRVHQFLRTLHLSQANLAPILPAHRLMRHRAGASVWRTLRANEVPQERSETMGARALAWALQRHHPELQRRSEAAQREGRPARRAA